MTLRLTRKYLEVLPNLLAEIRDASREGLAITRVLSQHNIGHVILYDLLELGILRRTNLSKSRPQYAWVENDHDLDHLTREVIRIREARFKNGGRYVGNYLRNRLDQRRCDRCGTLLGYGKIYLSRPTITQPLAICTDCVSFFNQPKGERELNQYTEQLLNVGDHVYSHELETYAYLIQDVADRLRACLVRDRNLTNYQELGDHADEVRNWIKTALRVYTRHRDRCHELHAKLGTIYTVGDLTDSNASQLAEQLDTIHLQDEIQEELRLRGQVMQDALASVARWLTNLGVLLETRHLKTDTVNFTTVTE